MSGPIPKRSEERIRRNIPDVPITKIEAVGDVEKPELELPDPHPIIQKLWDSIGESAQTEYYEPSDWALLRFALHFADGLVKSGRPSGQMFASIHSMFGDLLISEGARRRVRMEIERDQKTATIVDIQAEIEKRMGSAK